MATNQAGVSIAELVRGLLDRRYEREAVRMLEAVSGSVNSGIVAQRLAELQAEAARLQVADARLGADNPVLRALLADMDAPLRRASGRIDVAAADLQADAVRSAEVLQRQLALPGFDDEALKTIGIRWNVPDPEAVQRLIGFVDSPAWAEEIAGFPGEVQNLVRNQAIRGISLGWNPRKTAREIAARLETYPLARAETLARTVHLQSYRSAAAANQAANADILSGAIRVATLDRRTCLGCVALHGTRLETGERVNDHHNGRCTSIPVVRGRERSIQTGREWFDGLDESRQRQQISFERSPGKFDYFQRSGDLRDFVGTYEDRVFGEMVRELPLKSLS